MAMHEINIDGPEQKIFHDCVDKLQMGGKLDKPKKVIHSTVYRIEKSEEGEEEVEGKCLGMEVKISVQCLLYILVVWLVFHNLVLFCLFVLLLNLLILIFLYLSKHATFKSI